MVLDELTETWRAPGIRRLIRSWENGWASSSRSAVDYDASPNPAAVSAVTRSTPVLLTLPLNTRYRPAGRPAATSSTLRTDRHERQPPGHLIA